MLLSLGWGRKPTSRGRKRRCSPIPHLYMQWSHVHWRIDRDTEAVCSILTWHVKVRDVERLDKASSRARPMAQFEPSLLSLLPGKWEKVIISKLAKYNLIEALVLTKKYHSLSIIQEIKFTVKCWNNLLHVSSSDWLLVEDVVFFFFFLTLKILCFG